MRRKIALSWALKTKWRLLTSRKIKVGFGPITTGEDDLAERKWRIDPIIDAINTSSQKYVAGFFTHPSEMRQFDILILVKKINPTFMLHTHKLKTKKFIYDIVDNPNDEEIYRFYFRTLPGFIERMDGFILSSPVHMPLIKKPTLLIEHPILNTTYKKTYADQGEIRLLAQGYFENLKNLSWLHSLLPRLSQEIGKPLRLFYHSEVVKRDSEFVRYIKWSVANCFEIMTWADIALTIKNLHKPHQYTKPSTKVIAYMAAGLPVICKPTAADRLVIRDKVTGFFAYREEDWLSTLRLLARPSIRCQIGRAARNSVLTKYSVERILEKYLSLLDTVYALPLSPHP